jgi:hypothetical protein
LSRAYDEGEVSGDGVLKPAAWPLMEALYEVAELTLPL